MADIEDSKKEIELLNDAIVSLSEKIKESLDKSLRGVDKTTRKIANVFKNDLSKSADRVTDSLKNQDDLFLFQNILSEVDLIENYNVREFDNKVAYINIKYYGKINKIKEKLIEKGIDLNFINNQWSARLK